MPEDLDDMELLPYEEELAELYGKDGITDEIVGVLGHLEMADVVKAGGFAEHLRGLIREQRQKLRSNVQEQANRFGQGQEFVEKMITEIEPSIPELEKLNKVLDFVEMK